MVRAFQVNIFKEFSLFNITFVEIFYIDGNQRYPTSNKRQLNGHFGGTDIVVNKGMQTST